MKALTPALIVALGLFMSVSIVATQPPAESEAAARVTICHFGGHNGDFVTFRSGDNLPTVVCDNEGGNAIKVAERGCERGHQAAPRFRSCADGDLQT